VTILEPISAGTASWEEIPGLLATTGTNTIVLDPDLDATGLLIASVRQPSDLRRSATLGRPFDVPA
jgi:hypothetical protein